MSRILAAIVLIAVLTFGAATQLARIRIERPAIEVNAHPWSISRELEPVAQFGRHLAANDVAEDVLLDVLVEDFNYVAKEEFQPIHPGEVRVYTCGPTVYDYAHIGNFRSFLFADILVRYRGPRVFWLMLEGGRAFASFVALNFFFVDPRWTFRIADQRHVLTIVFFLIAQVTLHLLVILFRTLTLYAEDEEIMGENVAAALSYAGAMLAVAIIVGHAAEGTFEGWGASLRAYFPDLTLIVDAGIGAPSQAAEAMELGYDAVLLNTAVAKAGDPVKMAEAFARAVEAGRLGFEAGLIEPRDMASPSTPIL